MSCNPGTCDIGECTYIYIYIAILAPARARAHKLNAHRPELTHSIPECSTPTVAKLGAHTYDVHYICAHSARHVHRRATHETFNAVATAGADFAAEEIVHASGPVPV